MESIKEYDIAHVWGYALVGRSREKPTHKEGSALIFGAEKHTRYSPVAEPSASFLPGEPIRFNHAGKLKRSRSTEGAVVTHAVDEASCVFDWGYNGRIILKA